MNSSNLTLSGERLRTAAAACSIGIVHDVGWPARSMMPPCIFRAACLRILRNTSMLLPRPEVTGSASCVRDLDEAGCYRIAYEREVYAAGDPTTNQAVRFFQSVACARLVPRDGCMCLPCYTACRRSPLCPVELLSGELPPTPPLRAPPPRAHAAGRRAGAPARAARVAGPSARSTRTLPTPSSTPLTPFSEDVEQDHEPASSQLLPVAYVVHVAYSWTFVQRNGLRHWWQKYIRGAIRLALSLRASGSEHPLLVLGANLTSAMRRPLRAANLSIVAVPSILAPARYANRRHVGTWTKLNAWRLTEYRRLLSLDVDVIVRNGRALDELLTRQDLVPPAATAEGVPPARDGSILPFNSGVMLLRPSGQEHARMLAALHDSATPSYISYDGSEQGFLASYWARHGTRWSELPRKYNLFVCPQPDELEAAAAWHLNPNFATGVHHPTVRAVIAALDAQVEAVVRAPTAGVHS